MKELEEEHEHCCSSLDVGNGKAVETCLCGATRERFLKDLKIHYTEWTMPIDMGENMARTTEYRCNLCNEKRAEADLIGFKWDSSGAPLKIKTAKAVNHICTLCVQAIITMHDSKDT